MPSDKRQKMRGQQVTRISGGTLVKREDGTYGAVKPGQPVPKLLPRSGRRKLARLRKKHPKPDQINTPQKVSDEEWGE